MKNIRIFIFICISSLSSFCFSQEVKENIYEVLNEQQRGDWYKSKKNWEEKYFNAFLKKYKVKLSCANCSSVYVDVHFAIMEDGHTHVKVLQTKKCGTVFTAKQISELEKLLFNIEFPTGLYNTKFCGRIGRGLSC